MTTRTLDTSDEAKRLIDTARDLLHADGQTLAVAHLDLAIDAIDTGDAQRGRILNELTGQAQGRD